MKNINDIIKANGPASLMNGDNNSCTVKALSATFGISYDEAYEYAAKTWGRVKGKGVFTSSILRSFPDSFDSSRTVFGTTVERVKATKDYKQPDKTIKTRKMTLATFATTYKTGTYYILVNGHALAVIDGEVVDFKEELGRKVKYAWRVNK